MVEGAGCSGEKGMHRPAGMLATMTSKVEEGRNDVDGETTQEETELIWAFLTCLVPSFFGSSSSWLSSREWRKREKKLRLTVSQSEHISHERDESPKSKSRDRPWPKFQFVKPDQRQENERRKKEEISQVESFAELSSVGDKFWVEKKKEKKKRGQPCQYSSVRQSLFLHFFFFSFVPNLRFFSRLDTQQQQEQQQRPSITSPPCVTFHSPSSSTTHPSPNPKSNRLQNGKGRG